MRAAAILLAVAAAAAAAPTPGLEGRFSALLPASDLKARPPDRAAPLTLRVASVRPHGSKVQYDLRYIGLVPGTYDLSDYLVAQDGSPAGPLPPLAVEIAPLLPPQHPGALSPRPEQPLPGPGGYRWAMGGLAGVWILLAIPFFRSRRQRPPLNSQAAPSPPTLAERLRPLAELASRGALTPDQQAQLERMLMSHWRERLDLGELSLADATARLRTHPEAGGVLRALEDWLHRPPGSAKVDIDAVLATCGPPLPGRAAP